MIYAYARVSAADQNLARQIDSFLAFGVPKPHIYCDKKSGKDFERENYLRLLKRLKQGDLLVIKSIDRLGRNYDMIIEEWARITKTIGREHDDGRGAAAHGSEKVHFLCAPARIPVHAGRRAAPAPHAVREIPSRQQKIARSMPDIVLRKRAKYSKSPAKRGASLLFCCI